MRTCAARVRDAMAGFTLLELMVAMAVAAMLLAVVPPSLQRLKASADYRGTLRGIAADLATARAQAAAGGRDVAFRVDLEARRYGLEGGPPRAVPEGLRLRVTSAAEEGRGQRIARIRFRPDGQATGGSIEVIRPSGEGARLRADWLDGRVSLEPLSP
jgi:general secretion pathway protein H